VSALLGAGHQVPPIQIAKVVLLARSLGMPAGGEARWLARLAHDVGLDHQDPRWGRVQHLIARANVTRLFGLLALATSVFGDGRADRAGLSGLRRLTDLIRTGRAAGGGEGAEVTLADLRAEFRRHYQLGDDAPVSMTDLRHLVELTGQAKGALPKFRPVTREHLANAARAATPTVEQTPSGWYVRAGNAGEYRDEEQDRVAARSFPPVAGATVIHVHADPVTGRLAVEGRWLTIEQFRQQVLAPLRLPPGNLLIMMACGLGAARSGQAAGARTLARRGLWPVLAASADAFTTPAGAAVVGETGFDEEGRPVLVRRRAGWVLHVPGRAQPVEFGPDLTAVLAGPVQAALPAGTPVPVVGGHPGPVRFPAGDVRWARGGPPGISPDGAFVSVADTVRTELDPWLRERLRVPGVFDLALTDIDGALGTVRDGSPDESLGIGELARRLPEWGAADSDAIRLVTPVLAGRPFGIRPVTTPGMEVSQDRLAATVAAIQAHLDRLAPPPYHDFEDLGTAARPLAELLQPCSLRQASPSRTRSTGWPPCQPRPRARRSRCGQRRAGARR
jgi:hypothetical protein